MVEQPAPRAKKSLGQNFLQDHNIAAKIVRLLEISPEDWVLEIGPGPGMLSSIILESCPAAFYMVEKDNYWAFERQRVHFSSPAGVKARQGGVVLADALSMPWHNFTAPWKIIGNLPYNIASPLIWDILSQSTGLTRAVFMVQKEVALRLAAEPGCRAYGALSVWVQCHAKTKLEFSVPPQVFRPQPKVNSAVVSFTPLALSERPQAPAELSSLLKLLFQKRRKQLGSILRGYASASAALENMGISPELRPENLSPEQFIKISEFISCYDVTA